MSGGDAGWPGLAYGATEGMLAALHETDVEGIRSRFRKLRLRPFPDDIRSGTGVRVSYDLPRVLALSAVFDLNRLYVPQGHAVDIVQSTWPEWCRAYLAAAIHHGALVRPPEVPGSASPRLVLQPDAYGGTCFALETASTEPADASEGGSMPAICIDASRTVDRLARTAGSSSRQALHAAFASLNRAFGWAAPETPHRAAVEEMARGRGFLDEGPYFDRAEALLGAGAARFEGARNPSSFRRLQALIAYLERPAPLDAWKAEIGSEEDRPRLRHLLAFWAEAMGLQVRDAYPETMKALGTVGARDLALEYIAAARAEQNGGAVSPPET